MQSVKTTFSDKQKTSEAKFNEKRQNLDYILAAKMENKTSNGGIKTVQ